MSARTSALVFGVYVSIGVAVGLYAIIMFSSLQPLTPAAGDSQPLGAAQATPPAKKSTPQRTPRTNRDRLQRALRRTQALLERRTKLLAQKTAESKLLRDQLAQLAQLGGSTTANRDSQSQDSAAAGGDGTSQVAAAVGPLWDQAVQTELVALEQAEQIAELTAELAAAESEIAEIDEQAGQVLESLLAEQEVHGELESTARKALVKLSVFAVPVLVELLADERPRVRGWSAKVLGEIGPDAAEAVPDLMILLSDPVESVRVQARESIAEIET